MKFYKMMFFNTLIFGTLISVSSYSWMSMWMGLEINLLSIIPLLKSHNSVYSTESIMKYFITQSMASSILLFSILVSLNMSEYLYSNMSPYLMMMMNSALFIKMGAAPFHFWFPEVINGLNWNNTMLMLTWQKIAPMVLIMYNLNMILMMTLVIILSSLISSIQGLNQISLRKIMAYSSINHISWMLSAMINSVNIWLIYFIIYSIITLNLSLMFKKFNMMNIKQLSFMLNKNKYIKMIFMMNFLSLGGLPPFLGFLPKWLTINNLVEVSLYSLISLLIMFTLITLYFYLRLSLSSLSMKSEEFLLITSNNLKPFYITFNLILTFSLMTCIYLYNIY